MGELSIKYHHVADLIAYGKNARTHSDAQVSQIAASIREFGFTNPILIDEQNGIIAGHGRVLAAQKLGMATAPTITLSGLTDTQKRAYIIADNKLALNAGWDEAMLAVEFDDLNLEGFDLELTGFALDEIEKLNPSGEIDSSLGMEHDPEKFFLMIEYASETALQTAYDEAMAKGLSCKIIQ